VTGPRWLGPDSEGKRAGWDCFLCHMHTLAGYGTALVSDEAFFEPIDTPSVSLSQHSDMYDQFWEP
jgi:hypothetical protein